MSAENEQLVRAGIRAWNDDDWEALERGWVANPSVTAPEGWPEAGRFEGRAAVMAQMERLKSDLRNSRIEVLMTESAGDRVLLQGRWLGQGESSGLELDLAVWNVYWLTAGKVSHVSFNLDEASARAEFEGDSASG